MRRKGTDGVKGVGGLGSMQHQRGGRTNESTGRLREMLVRPYAEPILPSNHAGERGREARADSRGSD